MLKILAKLVLQISIVSQTFANSNVGKAEVFVKGNLRKLRHFKTRNIDKAGVFIKGNLGFLRCLQILMSSET